MGIIMVAMNAENVVSFLGPKSVQYIENQPIAKTKPMLPPIQIISKVQKPESSNINPVSSGQDCIHQVNLSCGNRKSSFLLHFARILSQTGFGSIREIKSPVMSENQDVILSYFNAIAANGSFMNTLIFLAAKGELKKNEK